MLEAAEGGSTEPEEKEVGTAVGARAVAVREEVVQVVAVRVRVVEEEG